MSGLDCAALTLSLNDHPVGISGDIAQPRLRVDDNLAPVSVLEGTRERRARAGHSSEAALLKPPWEIELPSVLPVWMDPDLPNRFRPKQVHRIGQHHGAFIEMPARHVGRRPRRWRSFHDKVIEIHCKILPTNPEPFRFGALRPISSRWRMASECESLPMAFAQRSIRSARSAGNGERVGRSAIPAQMNLTRLSFCGGCAGASLSIGFRGGGS